MGHLFRSWVTELRKDFTEWISEVPIDPKHYKLLSIPLKVLLS